MFTSNRFNTVVANVDGAIRGVLKIILGNAKGIKQLMVATMATAINIGVIDLH